LRRRPGRGLGAGVLAGLCLGGAALPLSRDLIPYRQPTLENARRGATFWEVAGGHGLRSTVVRVPATFPPEAFPHGEILSGLGVPDIRGTFGTFTFYTTLPLPEKVDENTEMGGKVIRVSLVNGEADSYLFGPRNSPLRLSPRSCLPCASGSIGRPLPQGDHHRLRANPDPAVGT
jgi:hypothetical protein